MQWLRYCTVNLQLMGLNPAHTCVCGFCFLMESSRGNCREKCTRIKWQSEKLEIMPHFCIFLMIFFVAYPIHVSYLIFFIMFILILVEVKQTVLWAQAPAGKYIRWSWASSGLLWFHILQWYMQRNLSTGWRWTRRRRPLMQSSTCHVECAPNNTWWRTAHKQSVQDLELSYRTLVWGFPSFSVEITSLA